MIFVDTGPFLARYIARDQHHSRAIAGWARLEKSRQRCFTSNFVLDEFFTLLARRSTHAFAAARARLIIASRSLVILRPGQDEETRAVDLFEKFADQEVSFTDCVSFALMRASKLRRAFAFDQHFERAGFELWP